MSDEKSRRLLAFGGLAIATCLASWLRWTQLHESFWVDELHTSWTVADQWHDVAPRARIGNNSPLYFWLLWTIKQMFGDAEAILRGPSFLSGVLLVPLCYLVVVDWFRSRTGGLLAALLVACDPYLLIFSVEARPYGLIQFLAVVHVYLFARVLITPSRIYRAGFVVFGVLLFHLHYTASLLFVAEAIAFLLLGRRSSYRVWQAVIDGGWITAACLIALPHLREISARRELWASFIRADPPIVGGTGQVGVLTIFPLHIYVGPALLCLVAGVIWQAVHRFRVARISKRGGSDRVRGDSQCSARDATFLIRVLKCFRHPLTPQNSVATAAVRPVSRRAVATLSASQAILISVCWLLVPVLLAWFVTRLDGLPSWHLARLFFRRYLVVVTCAPIVLAAGLVACQRHPLARFGMALLVAVCALAVVGPAVQYRNHGRWINRGNEDWRGAVAWVNKERAGKDVPVLLQPHLIEVDQLMDAEPVTDLAHDYCLLPLLGRYRVDGMLFTLRTSRPTEFSAELETQLRNSDEVWLIVRGRKRNADELRDLLLMRLMELGKFRVGPVRQFASRVHVTRFERR